MNVLSTDNMKKMVSVIAHTGNLGGKVFDDGQVTKADIVFAPDLFMLFPELFAIQFKMIVPEIKTMSAESILDLVAHFNREFDIPQDNVEWTIEAIMSLITDVLAWAEQGYLLYCKVIAIIKNKPQT
jgi:hypothetical protein